MGSDKRLKPLLVPVVLTGSIWAAFLLDWALPGSAFDSFGLVPRTREGAIGIVGMPFIHADWAHLTGNSVPLLVLSFFLVTVGRQWGTVATIVLLNGLLLWTFGRGNVAHGGASGLVYGLAGFLLALGLVEKRFWPALVGAGVALAYGGALMSGILPNQRGISWDGHLTGAVAGMLVAARSRRPANPPPQMTAPS